MTFEGLEIAIVEPRDADVEALLETHFAFAASASPACHVHALDAGARDDPDLTFYGARLHGTLVGVAALRRLDEHHAELKSMHTSAAARGRGVGEALLRHLLEVAARAGYEAVSLETGTAEAFAPARRLYERVGFRPTGPFASYEASPLSCYFRFELDGSRA